VRPGRDECRRMLRELLENIGVQKCRINAGYVSALSLKR
jgi:hypothetical protein